MQVRFLSGALTGNPSPLGAWRNWQTQSIWDRLAVFRLASSILVAPTIFVHAKVILYLTQALR
jgi:hypothetical protein